MNHYIAAKLSPFQHKDFRNFFIVQTLSQTGRWSHELARSWLILEIAGKASALGLVALMIALPSLFLILPAGVVVDKVNVKKLMLATKSFLAFTALTLAVVTHYMEVQLWMIVVIGVLEGFALAFDSPAFAALTVRLVPKNDFQQALILNSTNFHFGRMAGPLLAGLLMAFYQEPALVFLFDAVTYLFLIFVLKDVNLLNVFRSIEVTSQRHWQAVVNGFKYFYHDKLTRFKLMQFYLTIGIFIPLSVAILRTYVQKKFNLDADAFGYTFAFKALGSAAGALFFTFCTINQPLRMIFVSAPLLSVTTLILPQAGDVNTMALMLFVSSFFAYLTITSLTVSLHADILEEYRGRLGSVIGLGFLVFGPLVAFPVGGLGDLYGYENIVYISSLLFLLATLTLIFTHRRSL